MPCRPACSAARCCPSWSASRRSWRVALLLDALLHVLNAVWIGRYLGIPGTLLIIGSTAYSLRKRKLIRAGQPAQLLRWHEGLAWLGSLLVLVHAGIHFNAILGWLAVAAMLINVGSGLTGKFLLDRSRRRLDEARQRMRQQGLSAEELEDRTYWDSLTFDAVKQVARDPLPDHAGLRGARAGPHHRRVPVLGLEVKRRPGCSIVIAANLVVLVALAFVYPHLMVSPGPLTRGHAELATDCFACHAPWRGAAAQRCIECHALADIGLRSTKGVRDCRSRA